MEKRDEKTSFTPAIPDDNVAMRANSNSRDNHIDNVNRARALLPRFVAPLSREAGAGSTAFTRSFLNMSK
jgi:hypothetical protein